MKVIKDFKDREGLCEALLVPWWEIRCVLRQPYKGEPEQDRLLVQYVRGSYICPDWFDGFNPAVFNENGIYAIGPKREVTMNVIKERYDDHYGLHEAICIPWKDVEAVLRHPYEGSVEDDDTLVMALMRNEKRPTWFHEGRRKIFDREGIHILGPQITVR